MSRVINVTKRYLLFPIAVGSSLKKVEILCDGTKQYEFRVPVAADLKPYPISYYAPLKVEEYMEGDLEIRCEEAPYFELVVAESNDIPVSGESHPVIHMTAPIGWNNDPNGLIYKDGQYHMCYQFNPFNIDWENMSWGYAVSSDLLHWEHQDAVMYPDEDGTMFSGSGILNEKGMLGLPEDAMIYFYTCAGHCADWSRDKEFVQKIAYSTDNGNTVTKMDGYVVPHIVGDNRDPKVYYHEESGAYYMALYLDESDYAILRSEDLLKWTMIQHLTFEGTSECPDLRFIPIEGANTENGEPSGKWMFWGADGSYYLGDFDGYEFTTDYNRHKAYRNSVPYAAQTFWGTEDVITIPWLRIRNEGKSYTGAMGLPKKLTLAKTSVGYRLRQSYTDSYLEARQEVGRYSGNNRVICEIRNNSAVEIAVSMEEAGDFYMEVFGTPVLYSASVGKMTIGGKTLDLGRFLNHFSIIFDAEIVEVTAENGLIYAAEEIAKDAKCGSILVETGKASEIAVYKIQE